MVNQNDPNNPGGTSGGANNAPPTRRKRVEVLVPNLGHKLLKQGQVTDDPQYVKLLGDKRNLVREVKE